VEERGGKQVDVVPPLGERRSQVVVVRGRVARRVEERDSHE
jgi:hypothetical protein